MTSDDIKAFLANGTEPRMGGDDECKERWPEIDATNPKNWKRLTKFRVGRIPEEWSDLSWTLADAGIAAEYGLTPECIARVFTLNGSDSATWLVVTSPDDSEILLYDDIGD